MIRDGYEVLGLARGLDDAQYIERYNQLKAEYSEAMFLPSERGNEAARKLTELESAWAFVSSDLERRKTNTDFGSDFGQVDALIREKRFDEAQADLDLIMIRNAEWHYYQSVIFYKREWLTESRKHLLLAVQMDPGNYKYRESLEKLDLKMGNPNVPPQNLGNHYEQGNKDKMCNDNSLAAFCLTYCCLDCCCSMTNCC